MKRPSGTSFLSCVVMPVFFFLSQDMSPVPEFAHHDQGVLARVLVVAPPQRDRLEAEPPVQLLRREVRGADLERDAAGTACARVIEQPVHERLPDALALII